MAKKKKKRKPSANRSERLRKNRIDGVRSALSNVVDRECVYITCRVFYLVGTRSGDSYAFPRDTYGKLESGGHVQGVAKAVLDSDDPRKFVEGMKDIPVLRNAVYAAFLQVCSLEDFIRFERSTLSEKLLKAANILAPELTIIERRKANLVIQSPSRYSDDVVEQIHVLFNNCEMPSAETGGLAALVAGQVRQILQQADNVSQPVTQPVVVANSAPVDAIAVVENGDSEPEKKKQNEPTEDFFVPIDAGEGIDNGDGLDSQPRGFASAVESSDTTVNDSFDTLSAFAQHVKIPDRYMPLLLVIEPYCTLQNEGERTHVTVKDIPLHVLYFQIAPLLFELDETQLDMDEKDYTLLNGLSFSLHRKALEQFQSEAQGIPTNMVAQVMNDMDIAESPKDNIRLYEIISVLMNDKEVQRIYRELMSVIQDNAPASEKDGNLNEIAYRARLHPKMLEDNLVVEIRTWIDAVSRAATTCTQELYARLQDILPHEDMDPLFTTVEEIAQEEGRDKIIAEAQQRCFRNAIDAMTIFEGLHNAFLQKGGERHLSNVEMSMGNMVASSVMQSCFLRDCATQFGALWGVQQCCMAVGVGGIPKSVHNNFFAMRAKFSQGVAPRFQAQELQQDAHANALYPLTKEGLHCAMRHFHQLFDIGILRFRNGKDKNDAKTQKQVEEVTIVGPGAQSAGGPEENRDPWVESTAVTRGVEEGRTQHTYFRSCPGWIDSTHMQLRQRLPIDGGIQVSGVDLAYHFEGGPVCLLRNYMPLTDLELPDWVRDNSAIDFLVQSADIDIAAAYGIALSPTLSPLTALQQSYGKERPVQLFLYVDPDRHSYTFVVGAEDEIALLSMDEDPLYNAEWLLGEMGEAGIPLPDGLAVRFLPKSSLVSEEKRDQDNVFDQIRKIIVQKSTWRVKIIDDIVKFCSLHRRKGTNHSCIIQNSHAQGGYVIPPAALKSGDIERGHILSVLELSDKEGLQKVLKYLKKKTSSASK